MVKISSYTIYERDCKKIAILPQSPEVADGLTVGELVSYGRFPHQKGFGRLTAEDKKEIDWAMEVTGTDTFRHRSINDLSGGQRQRVWIAMALAQRNSILSFYTYEYIFRYLSSIKMISSEAKSGTRLYNCHGLS